MPREALESGFPREKGFPSRCSSRPLPRVRGSPRRASGVVRPPPGVFRTGVNWLGPESLEGAVTHAGTRVLESGRDPTTEQ